MGINLRVSIVIGVVIYLIIIFSFLKKGKMSLKYSLLWLLSAGVFILLAIFPEIITSLSKVIGIQIAANAVFAILIFCILIILISLTSIVSMQNQQIKSLSQKLALIEKTTNRDEK